jgi:hypothetical protein
MHSLSHTHCVWRGQPGDRGRVVAGDGAVFVFSDTRTDRATGVIQHIGDAAQADRTAYGPLRERERDRQKVRERERGGPARECTYGPCHRYPRIGSRPAHTDTDIGGHSHRHTDKGICTLLVGANAEQAPAAWGTPA